MKVVRTTISGAAIAEGSRRVDTRGSFARLFCARDLESVIADRRIVQINHSYTKLAGTIRGLHYQLPPYAEMKLVRCLKGRVFDVAVDLREGSDTFLRWQAEELSADNERMMIIPEGCAHGFQTLQPDSELLYLHTEFFHPEAEGGVAPTDPRVGIAWPLEPTAISERDAALPTLAADFRGIAL
jgi:dTDP-4-dehydrorhamnose 3,5-epimerase